MEGVISHGREVLRQYKGYKSGQRIEAWFQRWGMFIVGAGLVLMVWALWAEFSPRQYTRHDMRAYAIEYFNWAIKQ